MIHGDKNTVTAANPAVKQVMADVVLVHKGEVFRKNGVWFYIYDGALPDVMLSETLLNDIPCISHPGISLMDTRERQGDRDILRQYIQDSRELFLHHVKEEVQRSSHALNTAAAAPDTAEERHRQQNERIRGLLRIMEEQRERLKARLGVPVSDEALKACMSVLDRYPENFRPPGATPCKLPVFRLQLKDKSKFHICLPRRLNPIMLTEVRKQVAELVAQGVVERCTSQPSSLYAIVMVKKPNAPGKYRLCIDLVKLNENTMPMPYAVPELHESLDRLSGKKLYCTFDFSGWFHQFELAEEDRDKVAFLVPGDDLSPPQIYRY
jgi:hypothetical protein